MNERPATGKASGTSGSATAEPLPTGVVTLLFTDVVGSSRLWEEHGDSFIPVWQAHDAVLRDAFSKYGGHEVKSEGDAFMVAFTDPAAAVECALYAQVSLTRYPWPPDIGPIRVRMGLDTGEPFVLGSDFFGPTVNRAAHICGAATGGQILIAAGTFEAVDGGLDPSRQVTDLGERRLKDQGLPHHVWQVSSPELEGCAGGTPCTLDGQPNNLPVQRTSFVGRAKEIEQVAAYLAKGEKPLLTVTGPGGIGKTRLTLHAAASHAEWFPDGVWYVRLSEAKDAVGALVEIAGAMHIPLKPDAPVLPQVRDWLSHRQCLLILDDAGTLPHADRLIRDLLSGSSSLRCLATSRESLEVAEGAELPLGGLPTLNGAELLTVAQVAASQTGVRSEAARLFIERACTANPNLRLSSRDVAAVEELVDELDGHALSIERAAKMMTKVTPTVVLEWLRQRLSPERTDAARVESGAEKLRGIIRRTAQRVQSAVEETAALPPIHLGELLQGVANVATDRKNEKRAAHLGRQSLRLSQEAGDEVGVAAALRQLARVYWQQGNRESAVALLGVAVQIYRRRGAPDLNEAQKELDGLRDELEAAGHEASLPPVDVAVAIAMGEA